MNALIRASKKRRTALDDKPEIFEISAELWEVYLDLRQGRSAVFGLLPLSTADILMYLDCCGFSKREKRQGLRIIRLLDNEELKYWHDMKNIDRNTENDEE